MFVENFLSKSKSKFIKVKLNIYKNKSTIFNFIKVSFTDYALFYEIPQGYSVISQIPTECSYITTFYLNDIIKPI